MKKWTKAKALRNHTYGFYSIGDVVEVKQDGYCSGAYKIKVKKQGQVVARTTEPRRYFEIIEEE